MKGWVKGQVGGWVRDEVSGNIIQLCTKSVKNKIQLYFKHATSYKYAGMLHKCLFMLQLLSRNKGLVIH